MARMLVTSLGESGQVFLFIVLQEFPEIYKFMSFTQLGKFLGFICLFFCTNLFCPSWTPVTDVRPLLLVPQVCEALFTCFHSFFFSLFFGLDHV